jgi:hypothetical protein
MRLANAFVPRAACSSHPSFIVVMSVVMVLAVAVVSAEAYALNKADVATKSLQQENIHLHQALSGGKGDMDPVLPDEHDHHAEHHAYEEGQVSKELAINKLTISVLISMSKLTESHATYQEVVDNYEKSKFKSRLEVIVYDQSAKASRTLTSASKSDPQLKYIWHDQTQDGDFAQAKVHNLLLELANGDVAVYVDDTGVADMDERILERLEIHQERLAMANAPNTAA